MMCSSDDVRSAKLPALAATGGYSCAPMASRPVYDISPNTRPRLTAETSLEPDGLTRRVVLNLLEAFFKRPWLYLLPLVLMIALGVASVIGTGREFRSVGTLSTSNTSLLTDLTETGGGSAASWETPAAMTSRNLNELLRTQLFLRDVFTRAGVGDAVTQQPALGFELGESISATADGDYLVRVSATTDSPELSQRLAQASIDGYVQYRIDQDVTNSSEAATFLEARLEDADGVLTSARQDLDDYVAEVGASSATDIPLAQQLEIDRRTRVVDRAEAQYERALDRRDEAQLALAQAEAVTAQRLQEVDPPEIPAGAEPRLKRMALTVIMFAAIGVILGGALVVLAATLDRTIRIPNDVSAKFGLEVLAVVPDSRR